MASGDVKDRAFAARSAQEGEYDRDHGGEQEEVDRAPHGLEDELHDEPERDEPGGDPEEECHVVVRPGCSAEGGGFRALRIPAITSERPCRKWSSPIDAGSTPATNTCLTHRPITSATRGQRSGSMFGPTGIPSSSRRMISVRRLAGDAWSSRAIPVV